ncbi:hypothetical protein AB3X96_36090 [Paraburkholderia sp. BR13439]|uniref:hypothetical protein n=1 Tax=Paraburkholderia TaxID=1822464 RepID=UPI0034CF96B7
MADSEGWQSSYMNPGTDAYKSCPDGSNGSRFLPLEFYQTHRVQFVDASRHWRQIELKISSHLSLKITVRRVGRQPSEIGKAVVFLASGDASFVNGAELFD